MHSIKPSNNSEVSYPHWLLSELFQDSVLPNTWGLLHLAHQIMVKAQKNCRTERNEKSQIRTVRWKRAELFDILNTFQKSQDNIPRKTQKNSSAHCGHSNSSWCLKKLAQAEVNTHDWVFTSFRIRTEKLHSPAIQLIIIASTPLFAEIVVITLQHVTENLLVLRNKQIIATFHIGDNLRR